MDVTISKLQTIAELQELISVFQDVFEMDGHKRPGELHLENLLKKETFFAVIASMNNKIIGGLTVYVLHQYFSEKPIAHIYDLAVLKPFQRQGVGSKLMKFTIEYCKENGFEEVFVQAEKADDYAVDFYRLTKPTEELEAMHFSYKL